MRGVGGDQHRQPSRQSERKASLRSSSRPNGLKCQNAQQQAQKPVTGSSPMVITVNITQLAGDGCDGWLAGLR